METKTKIKIGVSVFMFVLIIVLIIILTKPSAEDKAKAEKEAKEKEAKDKVDREKKDLEERTCRAKLNLYRKNGKDYICPPKYSFGNKNNDNINYEDIWLLSKEDKLKCWMSDPLKDDCGWGSCDPALYVTPTNGQKLKGNIFTENYDTTNNIYFYTTPIEYTYDDYCKLVSK